MKTIERPGLYLAQVARDTPPHNPVDAIARWAGGHGGKGSQIPTWCKRLFDVDRSFESRTCRDEIRGRLAGLRHATARRTMLGIRG